MLAGEIGDPNDFAGSNHLPVSGRQSEGMKAQCADARPLPVIALGGAGLEGFSDQFAETPTRALEGHSIDQLKQLPAW
jgi:hypothetical protein